MRTVVSFEKHSHYITFNANVIIKMVFCLRKWRKYILKQMLFSVYMDTLHRPENTVILVHVTKYKSTTSGRKLYNNTCISLIVMVLGTDYT